MRKVKIKTIVNADFQLVVDHFDQDLLNFLNPPFPPAKIITYEGSTPGDLVHIVLDFYLFKQEWTSVISSQDEAAGYFEFVDHGKKLPFFLTQWEHTHRIEKQDDKTIITDAVKFRWKNSILTSMIQPAIWFQLYYRKARYKKFFKEVSANV